MLIFHPFNPMSVKDLKSQKLAIESMETIPIAISTLEEEEYYWIGLHPLIWQESVDKDCDFEAIKANYVSITPIQLDLTSYKDIETLNNWIQE